MDHNYPKGTDIMNCVEGDNWRRENYRNLYHEDALSAFVMISSKRMGLCMAQKVDDYPILNRLIRMGLNSDEGVITLSTLILELIS
jgi:hypothetical protein